MPRKPARSTKKAAKKTARKAARPAKRAAPRRAPGRELTGWITHTDFASTDPAATKAWCEKALGWKFQPEAPSPTGPYHMFRYSDEGGGGIGQVPPGEAPGSVPFVQVKDAAAAYAKAIRAGAEAVQPPEKVMEGVVIAIVRAPGGVRVGLAGET